MALDPVITKAMGDAARVIELVLQSQAPRKNGTLRDSVNVVGGEGKSGNIIFRASYKDYGVYLDYGTGPFNTYPSRGRYNQRPGSGVGKGGIIPRYWTSLNDTVRMQVRRIIQQTTQELIRTELKRVKIK